MTVYTVERCYDYEGCSLEAVFSTQGKADAFAGPESADSSREEPKP